MIYYIYSNCAIVFMRFFFSRTFIFHLTLAFVGFVFFCYLLLTFLKFFTYHNNLEEVPNLKGILMDDAKKIILDKKLRFEVLDSSKFTPDFSPLSIIDHIPNAGDFVKKNRKIYLTINPSGYRDISIPNVIQITKRNAETKLKSVGFELGEIFYRDNIGKNMVLEIRFNDKKILPGDLLPKTSKIDLVLGNGKKSN